jgi:hypothetical protein
VSPRVIVYEIGPRQSRHSAASIAIEPLQGRFNNAAARRPVSCRYVEIGVGQRYDFGNVSETDNEERKVMNSIVYLVGLVVIVIAILSFIGVR